MSAHDLHDPMLWSRLHERIYQSTERDVRCALATTTRSIHDLAALLSPAAADFLEPLAAEARRVTLARFGRTVVLYVPLYVSNECVNNCSYCGFSIDRELPRRTLTLDEVELELDRLKAQHFDHLLLLTGEDRRAAPLDYLQQIVKLCHQRFSSVAVEIYPLDQAGYATLVQAGCDGLTLYQETYHHETYARVHPAGPKASFDRRLDAPARAAAAGMRSVGIGALLGLADWRVEGLCLAVHGRALRKAHWRSRLSIGFPRLRTTPGAGLELQAPDEAGLAQLIFALRLGFPDADLVLSTRERREFRDGMIGLGVTRMSAGSCTRPGGYALATEAGAQFDITDARSPAQVATEIAARGYEPVWKDFDQEFLA